MYSGDFSYNVSMQKYSIISSFESLPVEIFWYPAQSRTSHIILLLKGLYSLHNPKLSDSWDAELIRACNSSYHFICINTARRGAETEERSRQEAFIGKTFTQECGDIQSSFRYLTNAGIFPRPYSLSIVANSFGGTTLLGIPNLLHAASAVVMIGSGCGKSPTTTKPLLATLPDENALLHSLRSFSGVFAFIRGARDTVVPKESQNKIVQSALSSRAALLCTVAHATHTLEVASDRNAVPPAQIIASLLRSAVSLTRQSRAIGD